MSLESKISKNVFQGNGTTKTFSFTFRVWKEDQVLVYVGIGDETETDVTSSCSITLSENGGTVTFPTAPAVGMTVVIMRNMPFIQEDQYITGTRFDPHEIEDRLDQDCAERQQLLDGVERAVKVPVTSNTKPEDYMAAFWKAVADILKSVGIVADAEDYIKRYVSGIPIIKKSLAEVESGADGYYWVTGFGDAGKPGHDISGRLVTADGSTESRTLGERFADIVNVKDFGAKGDGVTDDTEAIMRAAEVAAARPASLYMPGSYLVHGLILPENTHVLGRPLFIDDGSGEESSYLVVFGRNSSIDDISLKMVENGHYRYGVRFNEGCSAGTVYVYAEGARFNGEAAHLMGDRVSVGFLHTTYINRGGTVGAYSDIDRSTGKTPSGVQYYQNIRLGGYHIDGCVQGLRLGRLAFSEVGTGSTIGLPDDVERTPAPGYNGVYISSCHDISVGDIASERALEHAVRIGGDDVAPEGSELVSYDIKFGDITAYRHGGSALKVNPGVKQRARNIYVGNVTSIDAGKRSREVNRRLSTVRVSHCDAFHAKYARSITYNLGTVIDGTFAPETDVVEVNNSTRVVIDNVYADIVGSSLIAINEENDVTLGEDIQSYSELGCRNLKFNNVRLSGHDSAPEFCMSRIYNTGMVVRNVAYGNVDVKGLSFTEYLHIYTAANFYDVYLDAADATGKLIDVAGGKIYVHGRALGASPNILASSQRFNRDSAISTASILVKTPVSADVTGLSGAITFLRPSGNRPAGAVAGVQSEDQEGGGYSGLEFLTSGGTEATNALVSVWRMLPGRQLYPVRDNSAVVGLSSNRLKEIFCANGSINTSDAREKQDVAEYPDAVLDAWGEVELRQFLFRDAVEKKGESARIHAGVIAQQVVEAFGKHGLDATRYGLFCHDEWGDEYETVEVEDAPAAQDSEGNEVTPAKTHTEKRLVTAAGDRYGIRYSEALCLEAAYQRRRAERMEQRIANIEALLNQRG